MQQMTYTLDMFEGPLDLLLHLIEQHKLDIRDIPIALLLEQYLAALDKQGTVDPDSMSEFLMMATKLIYIKSRMLLPMEEGEEDPRAELVSMLADYLHYKELAGELGGRYEQYGRRLFVRPQEQMGQQPPELRQQPLPTLLEAYKAVFRSSLRRVPPPIESFRASLSTRRCRWRPRPLSCCAACCARAGCAFTTSFTPRQAGRTPLRPLWRFWSSRRAAASACWERGSKWSSR